MGKYQFSYEEKITIIREHEENHTGNTEQVANYIANTTGGDLFALEPVNPYTNEDLNWTVDGSRVNLEHEDESLRDIELVADTVENWDSYDTVFIGYPIWWGIAASPGGWLCKSKRFYRKDRNPLLYVHQLGAWRKRRIAGGAGGYRGLARRSAFPFRCQRSGCAGVA